MSSLDLNALCCLFEARAFLFSPQFNSSLGCVNVLYLFINSCRDVWASSLRTIIAVWLNASQRSRVDVGMNRSAIVKRFKRSNGLDTALYKNIPLPFYSEGVQV